jgi:hypothetical protein
MQGCPFIGEIEENELISDYLLLNRNFGVYRNGTSGTSLFWKQDFSIVNGYDERMQGWGYDDYDFYIRLLMTCASRIDFPQNVIKHIHHSDEDRVKNFEIKDCNTSNNNNIEIVKKSQWNHDYEQKKMNVKIIYQGTEEFKIV